MRWSWYLGNSCLVIVLLRFVANYGEYYTINSNKNLYNLLVSFRERTGYGVLCNTSLNFNGRGFINRIDDLSSYVIKHNLDGFVVEGRCYVLKSSKHYQSYLKKQ